MLRFFVILVYISTIVTKMECGKVLFLPLHYSASHKKSMLPLADALSDRGHDVTVFNVVFAKVPIKGTRNKMIDLDLVITTENKLYNELWVWKNGTDILDGWNAPELKPWDEIYEWYLNIDMCKHALDQYPYVIQNIIDEDWDLIIMDTLMAPCGILIADKSPAPHMLFSTSYALPSTLRHLAIPQPIDSSPINEVEFDFRKFWHRAKHTLIWHLIDPIHYRLLQWMHKWVLWQKFPLEFDWKQFDRSSLLNFHSFSVTLDDPKPSTLDNIALGDTPCSSADLNAQIMPIKYQKFIAKSSSKGTILAAFGHNVDWNLASNTSITALSEAFRQLTEYQIIWQYNGPKLPNEQQLGNVMITKWLPQTLLLLHNSTKLFISHMGLKSSFEGLCARVPFLAIPVYAEQPLNARIITGKQALGMSMSKFSLNAKEIVRKTRAILTDPSFNYRINKMAKIAGDKLIDPLKVGAFWADFAKKHRNELKLMKIRGQYLNHIVYYNVDVIVMFLFSTLCIPCLIVALIMKFN